MFLMIPVASVLFTLLTEATNKRLAKREIDQDKLTPQPPDLVRPKWKKRKKK